jgi:hypothetical protein
VGLARPRAALARDLRQRVERPLPGRRWTGPGARHRFTWTTFNVRVDTTVVECVPSERLAWRGKTVGGTGYHGWVIERTAAGCRVVTEETQRGIVPSLARWYLRRGLLTQHQRWLEGLARAAVAGMPG